MRVIGGEARGRVLSAPALATLRPTSDRVREAIFDILGARGLVEGASFLDLFAGSGALGIEALSRGAAACTFVESDPRAAAAVERNLDAVGYLGRPGVRVVRLEVLAYLGSGGAGVHVALLDPPYRYSGWGELLGALDAEHAVLEHAGPLDVGPAYVTIRSYRYGGTLVTLAARNRHDEDSA